MVSQTKFDLEKLLPRRLPAVRNRAKTLGLSQAEYVKRLIQDDLARERRIRETPLRVLAVPLHEALKKLSDDEIDALVETGRKSGKCKRATR